MSENILETIAQLLNQMPAPSRQEGTSYPTLQSQQSQQPQLGSTSGEQLGAALRAHFAQQFYSGAYPGFLGYMKLKRDIGNAQAHYGINYDLFQDVLGSIGNDARDYYNPYLKAYREKLGIGDVKPQKYTDLNETVGVM